MRMFDWCSNNDIDFGDRFSFCWQTSVDDYVRPRRWAEYDRWMDDFLSVLRENSTADDVGWVSLETVAPLEHIHDAPTEEEDDCSFIDDLI